MYLSIMVFVLFYYIWQLKYVFLSIFSCLSNLISNCFANHFKIYCKSIYTVNFTSLFSLLNFVALSNVILGFISILYWVLFVAFLWSKFSINACRLKIKNCSFRCDLVIDTIASNLLKGLENVWTFLSLSCYGNCMIWVWYIAIWIQNLIGVCCEKSMEILNSFWSKFWIKIEFSSFMSLIVSNNH